MPTIQADITYWVITLKSWIADWVNDNAQKEDYGEEECQTCWLKVILANNIWKELECYQISSSYNIQTGTTLPVADPCLTDSDVERLCQLASSIINNRSGC